MLRESILFQNLEKVIFERAKDRIWIRGDCLIRQSFRIKISLETIILAKLENFMNLMSSRQPL